jgi:hypothetical protein
MSETNSTLLRHGSVQKIVVQQASSSVQQGLISYMHWSKSFCFSEQCDLNSAGPYPVQEYEESHGMWKITHLHKINTVILI